MKVKKYIRAMLNYDHVEDTGLNFSNHREYWFKKGYNFIFKL